MAMQRNFAVIGGDMRIIRLANKLHAEKNNVLVYGIHDKEVLKAPCTADLSQAIYNADILLLPLPMLNTEGNVNAPYCDTSIALADVLRLMNKNQILLGGKVCSVAKKLMDIHGVYCVDYFEREELTVANAMITAEGAIQTLLNAYPKTICSSKVLILGYGRIGKFLAKILTGFGADITVAGRRADTRAWVESSGYRYVDIGDNDSYTATYDIVFNTAPYSVLTQSRIDALSEDCVIIDLASAPGGTDFEHAKKCGITAIHALSLPGKTAPISAGDAIKNTILHICNDLGV